MATLGQELERLRLVSGRNQSETGALIRRSRQQVGKLEGGTRVPSRDDAAELDKALATGGVLEQLWVELSGAREVPEEWRDFVSLEQQATEIREYQMTLIPGLLQTEAYARMLLRRWQHLMSPHRLENLVANRVARLSGLTHHPVLWFVLDEVVVRRVLGSPHIMKEQLDWLRRLIDDDAIRVSVVPMDTPPHPGLDGSFRIANLENGQLVAHVDHLFGEEVVNKAQQVNHCVSLFGSLLAEALTPHRSAEFIDDVRKGV